jgi:serine/threonine-protein kinase
MLSPFGDLAAGASLGRYELLLPVAQGGMAQVWAARLKGTRGFSKTVAVKTMLPALSADAKFEKMFLAEAEIAARIKHPNVCEILDLGEQDGVLYLVMEWIDGESLVTIAADGEARGVKIPYEVATRIVIDAARGLHAAHELKDDEGAPIGVVHRDVSPHNVLVTTDGIVKIVDFGVAKAVARSDHQVTTTGHLKGKVQYMSPEQVFCEEIDRRADVFALGLVLYQLTTGTHPFRMDNELATLARITAPEPVPGPETVVPDYPPELARVVNKAIAKNKAERYASMAELGRDLEGVLAALAAAGHAIAVEAFVAEVTGARSAERAAAIKAAARAADERAGKSSAGAGLRVAEDATHAPVTVAGEPRSGRSMAIVAAAAAALGLGAGGLLWSGRSPAPAVQPTVAAQTQALPAGLPSATAAPQPATAAAPSVTAAPADAASAAPSATASAPAAASAAPRVAKPRSGPTRPDAPKSSLRNPGF